VGIQGKKNPNSVRASVSTQHRTNRTCSGAKNFMLLRGERSEENLTEGKTTKANVEQMATFRQAKFKKIRGELSKERTFYINIKYEKVPEK